MQHCATIPPRDNRYRTGITQQRHHHSCNQTRNLGRSQKYHILRVIKAPRFKNFLTVKNEPNLRL